METPYLTPTTEMAPARSDVDIESSATKESLTPNPLLNKSQDGARSGKLGQVVCLSLPASAVLFGITIYAPLVDRLKVDYNATTVEYNLNITFALVGVALAPLVLNPLLDVLGGKRAILLSWLLFIILNIGSAFVNNLGGLVVIRFFAFLFGGPILSLLQTSLANLKETRAQHLIFSLVGAACLLGLSMGPVVGGLIEGHATGMNRDWSRYLVPIVSLITIIPYAFFGRQHATLAISTIEGSHSAEQASLLQRMKLQYVTIMKPFIFFNTREFIVIGVTLYLSQIYFFFFVTLGAFPYAFGQIRGYNTSEVALTFLSLVVGVILSTLVPLISIRHRSISTESHKVHPEVALRGMLFVSILIPIGLFLFAWTGSMPHVHWSAPMIGMIIFAFGSNVAFTQLNVYLSNTYETQADTALACPLVSQSLTASIAPLLTLFMIHRVTFQGSLSILAGVLLGLTAIPVLLWWKGDKLRNRSLNAHKA